MKKLNVTRILPVAVATALPLLFCLGCGSIMPSAQAPAAQAAPANASGVEVQRPRPVIIDWMNSNLVGVSEQPDWLAPMVLGNTNGVRSAYNIPPNDVVKYSVARNPNRDEARVQAGLLLASKTASELKQLVVTAAAQVLERGMMQTVEDITTATKLEISGLGTVCDFWQYVETTDPTYNMKTREYAYYIVYRIPQRNWSAMVEKYLIDVIGKLPDSTARMNMANAVADVARKTNVEEQRDEAEFKQELELRDQAAKNAQAQDMARINQQTVQSQNAADVARAQVQADADARYAAYRSGNATSAAIAATTAGDADWLDAVKFAADVIL
jgi:hypothetical protein